MHAPLLETAASVNHPRLAGAPPSVDTISALTMHSELERQERLPISTPSLHSLKSNITTQKQSDITNTPTGDIPPPHFMNSIDELRRFSSALSAFISRYDELHNHLNFIKSSIDSKLPKHLIDTTNPNRSALTCLFEISCDQTITDFPEVTVLEQNPKEIASDSERSLEIAKTLEITNFSHNSEETDTSKKPVEIDNSKKIEQIDLSHKYVETDASKNTEEIDTLKKSEEIVPGTVCDQIITDVPEAIFSEENPNGVTTNGEQCHENTRTSETHEEIDASKKLTVIDTLKNSEVTVPETSCDQTITAVPEAIVSEQNPNGMVTNCVQIHQNVRTPESLEEIDASRNPEVIDVSLKSEEIDTLKKTEETVPETSYDQTINAVPEAIVSEQNPNRMATNCKQSHENVRTPEILEEIDILKKPEQTDLCKYPEEIDILKKPEQTDICKNPENIDVLQKPEEIDPAKFREETVTLKNHEDVDTLKKHEQTGIWKEAKKTGNRKKKVILSALEYLCQTMNFKIMKKHVAEHYSDMINLRPEIAKALKLANDPANLVLHSIGRFFVQGSRSFRKGSGHNHLLLIRRAAVLILECFVMISSDGIKIAKEDQEYAAKAAFDWRKRMIGEGGLRHTEEVDARGLLLLISGFGIQDRVFKIQDLMDLIMASNVKGISTALCHSVFLIPKIPEVIYLMAMSNLEIEAVDIAYAFGLEDMCHPRNILTTYLNKKVKDIQIGSSSQMLEAMKQQFFDLKSVKQCLESHNIDPSMLLPDFKMNEKIQKLEKEINEGKQIQKRKSLEGPIHQEANRACFGHENMPHQQKPVDHYGSNPYNRSTQPSASHFDFDRNLRRIEKIDASKNPGAIDVSMKPEEIDTLKKTEETVPETSYDQTSNAVPEAIVSEQNPSRMATNCQQSHENVRTPEILEVIDIVKKPEQTDLCKNPEEIDLKKPEQTDLCKSSEEIDILKKPEQTDLCKNPEDIDVVQKPEEIDPSKIREEINTLKNHEDVDTLKKHEQTGIWKKAKKTGKTKRELIVTALEYLCQAMNSKIMKMHVTEYYSEMINLRPEIAKALKLAKDPANLVLNSIGRFLVQSSRSFCKDSHQNSQNIGSMAAVLILECFVMISSDGIKIAKPDQEHAAKAAFDWRNRVIREGGLRHTDEVDARGLLLLISGFGIQDHVFKIQDIVDLIMASNVKGISSALCHSVFLIPKIPEVIYLMAMNNLEIEAVDIAYTFELEDICHPRKILTTYLHKKIKDIQNESSQMLEAMKQQLSDLKSVTQCLESHNIDPSKLLPDFNINEKIQNLEKEINKGQHIQKRKSLENPIHQEAKRACLSQESMPHQQKPVDHYATNPYSYNTNYSASSVYNIPAMPENIPGPVPNGVACGFPGSYYEMVHPANVQPHGWHGSYYQRYPIHGQTYDSSHYGRPWGWGPPSGSGGFPGRRGPSSDLYRFADIVEKESRSLRSSGSNGV